MEKILVIGAAGQIGSELTLALRKIYGNENVFATDIKDAPKDIKKSGPFQLLDVMDDKRLIHFVIRYKISQIYLLAAVLSGNAERLPLQAWDINMRSVLNILDLAREVGIKKIFWPSSIAVFGNTTPKTDTPQLTIMEPNTVYGISKLAGERWVEYYFNKYGLDIRSIRYPGLISYKTEAGGGTTDYAVEIFYDAIETAKYECFLKPNTKLPMMFMDDAIRATTELMEADSDKISVRSSYNLSGISFDPQELSDEIKKHIPDFEIIYKPDFRQSIADSWPQSIDDSVARKDWGWKNNVDLEKMTKTMLKEIKKKLIHR
ncbi:MAG TPA: NAD-dependent epimerase/dehydratase family protein [Ignavibacteria bacterium]|nr:NAD-dependent epimerase/dehydratase family protein [Ignavibacteria bacterium]HRJ99504.1 NAD-dependent epimerase/dehydratase family protein [Ignavibacteria bacterium]HRK00092.1 NAD-dependent epimerase/dehydratase family protein [Ignavibacteria bacterium]